MTHRAIEWLASRRIGLMLGMIEGRFQHPAVDQNRFRDYRRGVARLFDVVTKGAAGKVRARVRRGFLLRLVGIDRDEHRALQFVARPKLLAQLSDLLRDKT